MGITREGIIETTLLAKKEDDLLEKQRSSKPQLTLVARGISTQGGGKFLLEGGEKFPPARVEDSKI